MKVKEKYIDNKGGYIRFESFELNWNFSDWALPFSIDWNSKYILFTRFLCLGIYFFRK